MRYGALFAVLSLVAGEAQAANTQDNKIVAAAPYVTAALVRPMRELYDKAERHDATDMLTMGLALFAGRQADADVTEDDIATIEALDARIAEPVAQYTSAHPDDNHTRVNWRRKLKVTKAEGEAVQRYEAAYLADYWLGYASSRTHKMRINKFVRPTTAMIDNHMYSGGDSLMGMVKAPVLDATMIRVAAHCVYAVRKAAGLEVQLLSEHPMAIRLLRDYITYDAETTLNRDLSEPYGGVTGAAACGTPDQFDAYVALVKAHP